MSRKVFAALAVIFVFGCGGVKVDVKQPKKEVKQEVCKSKFKKAGKYCAVVISECKLVSKETTDVIVSIAVLYTRDGGKLAAEESLVILSKYFKVVPDMYLLFMAKIGEVPVYTYIAGVEQ